MKFPNQSDKQIDLHEKNCPKEANLINKYNATLISKMRIVGKKQVF